MKIDLMFEDWQKIIKDSLGKEQWIIVYLDHSSEYEAISFYCALIPSEMVDEVLKHESWDLLIGHGLPGHIYYGATKETKYFRFGDDDGIEPLVICRYFYGIKESYEEVSEEFRHYHNLYYDIKNNKYIKIDEDGNEEEVITLNNNEIKIRLKFIKEFISVKKMCLSIYFELDRYAPNTLQELGMKEVSKTIKEDNYIYNLSISNYDYSLKDDKRKSFSRLLGKKIIKGLKEYKPDLWIERENKEYADFIIGIDEEGKDIYYTSNPDKLANYFGANPGAPHYLTPIFFKMEVLSKYYSNPQKYSVEDNRLRCKGLWSLRLDNNHDKYVIVFLGDLGRDLSIKEQLYWKSFNIAPEGHISFVTFKRGFLVQFADPERSDLLFKYKFKSFQEKWFKKFSWYLFKPLANDDKHFYQSLRIPLTNDQSEFDQQVLALTKVLIDSLNEKELQKSIIAREKDVKSITKFEEYLKSNKLSYFDKHISFLRNLQDLRSSGVGHRKGENYKRISLVFHIEERNIIDIFDDILKSSILLLDYLEEHFLK